MDHSFLLKMRVLIVCVCLFLSGCIPQLNHADPTPQPDETPAPADTIPPISVIPSPTPTMCTGWNCEITGVVYADAALPGNELKGISVNFSQTSWCSPTAGAQEALSGQDGSFSVNVYIHDTDTIIIQIDSEGYQPARIMFGGFDCLFCSCPPLEIVLTPEGS